jgi:hypothetical protein
MHWPEVTSTDLRLRDGSESFSSSLCPPLFVGIAGALTITRNLTKTIFIYFDFRFKDNDNNKCAIPLPVLITPTIFSLSNIVNVEIEYGIQKKLM